MKNNFLNFLLVTFFFIFNFFFLTSKAYAQASLNAINDPVGNHFKSLGDVLTAALPIVFGVVGFLALIIFIIGAVRYSVSRGDPKAVDGARGTMTGAVIGMILVFGAAAVSGVFKTVFGISFFGGDNTPGTINSSTNSFDLRCAFKLTTGSCIGDKYSSLGTIVSQVLLLLISAGGLIFFFMLLWGGIRYMAARGDEKAVADARTTLTNALVGLLLTISAIVIINLITLILFNFKII